jgi:hypothetical protein
MKFIHCSKKFYAPQPQNIAAPQFPLPTRPFLGLEFLNEFNTFQRWPLFPIPATL